MDRPNLTPRQQDVLDTVKRYREQRRMSPTYTEIGAALGIDKVSVHELVLELAKKGYISRVKHKSRSIKILDDCRDGVIRTAIAELRSIAAKSAERQGIVAVIRKLEGAVAT